MNKIINKPYLSNFVNTVNSKLVLKQEPHIKHIFVKDKNAFDKNKHFYVCSYGGSGSTMLCAYLSNFGNGAFRYPFGIL